MYPKKRIIFHSFPYRRITKKEKHGRWQCCKFAELLLYSILTISSRILHALEGPNKDKSCNKICIGKVKSYKTRGRSASCVAVFSLWLWTTTLQVLFVLRFSISDKKGRQNRSFNPRLGFKNGRKDEQCSQIADVCIKRFLCYCRQYSLFSDL